MKTISWWLAALAAPVNKNLTWINSRCHSTFRTIVSRIPNERPQRCSPVNYSKYARECDRNRNREKQKSLHLFCFFVAVSVPLPSTDSIVLPERRWWSLVAFVLLFRFRFFVYLFKNESTARAHHYILLRRSDADELMHMSYDRQCESAVSYIYNWLQRQRTSGVK